MLNLRVTQPFGHALVELGKAFFHMEQERDGLRRMLDLLAGKPSTGCVIKNIVYALSFYFTNTIFLRSKLKRLNLG